MKYALILLGVLAAIVVIVVAIGYSLPVEHRATAEATYSTSADSLFELITDVASFPKWRTGVQSVEDLSDSAGHRRFREVGKNGSILYEVDESIPGKRLVTMIADRSLPFGGTWTYDLIPRGSATTLRITEDGEVYNPVFRFVSRFVMGHTATIDQYLTDVARRFAKSS